MIPGIDDGPETLEQSIEFVRAAAAQGTRLQAATPHLHPNFPDVHPEEIAERLQAVREAVSDEDIELVSGGEVSVGWALDATAEQLQLVSYGQRDSDILLETPSSGFFGLDMVISGIQARGYRVVLAHPERSITSASDFDKLEALSARGVLLQVNAESLLSRHKDLAKSARRLCRDGLASVIASDGHRGSGRRPVTVLADGVAQLSDIVGEERAEWMSSGVPEAVLRGQRLPPEPPVRKSRGLLRRR